MSAVYILASPGLRFLPEAGAINLLAEKSAVFAGYIFALGFRLRESGAGARLRLATSEAGMAASIQRPVAALLYIFGLEYTVGLGKELARRVFGYQRDDLRAFFLGEAWPPTGAGTVAESVHPCEIEPVEALSDGLWMTAELLGDLEGTQPLPTQRDDTGT